uniref:Histone H1.8 n=1 Tax=Sus scrofa TaxID=9823 RepID=A0A8D0JUU1_PIG
MAPGSIASSDTSSTSSASKASSASLASLTSTLGSSKSSGCERPGLIKSSIREPRRHPPVLRMVLEALQAGEQRRGTSVAAIKVYILQKYPTVDVFRLKYLLKQALATGMHRGLLVRPVNSKAKGATGSFKLVPKHKRKIQSRKTSTLKASRRPGQAEEKDPKKAKKAKKDPPNPGEVKKGSRKPGQGRSGPAKTGEGMKAPQKGNKTLDQEARLGEARKCSQQPDRPTQSPPRTTGPGRKAKVKAEAEAPGKTNPGSRNSKSTDTKGENGTAKTKMGNKIPKEAVTQGTQEAPNAKAPPPAKGSGSKMEPKPPARKVEAPKGLRKPGIPTTASSSKVASKKAEAKN